MALVLTEEESILADAARSFFARSAPVSAFRALRDSGAAERYSPARWAELAGMGFPGALIPESHGGTGFGYVAAGLIAQEAGRTLVASPLLSSALAAEILLRDGDADQQALLPGVADGSRLIAFAIDDAIRHDPDRLSVGAFADDAGFILDGVKRLVVDGSAARTLIVAATSQAGPTLLLVDVETPGVSVEPLRLIDNRDAADISFSGVQVKASAVIGRPGGASAAIDRALDVGRALLSAELLGCADEAFDRTVAYLKEREQFGVKIGSFQALQHRAARLHMALELARGVVLKALRALDAGDEDASLIASVAKAALAQTARRVLDEAVQLHGGIGVTDDLDIGLFLKRVRTAGDLFGDDAFQKDRLARLAWKI
jgi:alkylation response protein AidB-like acyl-CoA dehydrogenase